MASERKPALITAGPFLGLGATNQGPYENSGLAAACSSANPNRFPAALTAELGRANIAQISFGTGTGTLSAIAPYIASSSAEQIVGVLSDTAVPSGEITFLYDPSTMVLNDVYDAATGYPDARIFDQAVQFGGNLYLNSGRQYTASAGPGYNTYQWHYPAPTALQLNVIITGTGGTTPVDTFYYAFTRVVYVPSITGSTTAPAFSQETSEYGADVVPNYAYPLYGGNAISNGFTYLYSVSSATLGTPNATITGNFNGTNPDGSLFYTNIYRQSQSQPVWYLVTQTNGPGFSGNSFTDTYSNTAISANAQLTFRRDPPPIGFTEPTIGVTFAANNLPAICIHKERTWAFTNGTLIPTSIDTVQPPVTQCVLYYSNSGRPWEFDYVNNILEIGNSATPNTPGTYQSAYGDEPVALCSLSSVLVALKSRTLWVIYGDDQTSFVARQVFSGLGCRARQSVATGPLGSSLAMFWLSEHGVFVFDGSTPLRIDEDVRSIIRTVPLSDRVNAVGMYANLTYYISFPASGFTLGYFTNTAKWFYLPYATNFAYSVPANPAQYAAVSQINEVTAVRAGTNAIDAWFAGGELDLGQPQTVVWTTPLTDSGQPHIEKEFTHIICSAPIQAGLLVTVNLYFDGVGTPFTYTFDMSQTTRGICEVPQYPKNNRSFLAYMTISYQTAYSATGVPFQVYGVAAYGDFGRDLVLPQ